MTTVTVAADTPVAGRPPKRILPALIAGATGFVAVALSTAVAPWTVASSGTVAFPAEVATYSWFTAHGDLGMPATMIYQNGIGVEFMDFPQGVALGADGSTYRRVESAEQRSAPTDQGDPAAMVLSADGTFAVIAGPNRHGNVVVRSLVDGATREVPIGAGRSAVPLSIASDGDHVLVLLGEGELSRYTDPQRNGTLALLELSTGDLLEYPLAAVTTAALAADGSRLVAQTAEGAVMMDAAGRGIRELPAELDGQAFGDDAWSPDGTRVVAVVHDTLWVDAPAGRTLTASATLQVSDLETGATTELPLDGVEYAAALGWRDDDTIVVQSYAPDNSAEFQWVDAATGAAQTFSIYRSGFTGASIGSADLARDLVREWVVEDASSDHRWWFGIVVGIAVGAGVGLVAWRLMRKDETPAM